MPADLRSFTASLVPDRSQTRISNQAPRSPKDRGAFVIRHSPPSTPSSPENSLPSAHTTQQVPSDLIRRPTPAPASPQPLLPQTGRSPHKPPLVFSTSPHPFFPSARMPFPPSGPLLSHYEIPVLLPSLISTTARPTPPEN